MARSATATRQDVLDAAERLMAERGIHGVSLRDIAIAAGQANPAVVQYHFTDRDGLVRAVFERRMTLVDARRNEMLARLDCSGLDEHDHPLHRLVDAVIRPAVDVWAEAGGWSARFAARMIHDPEASAIYRALEAGSSRRDARTRLDNALEHLPETIRSDRLNRFGIHVTASIAAWEAERERGEPGVGREVLIEELVTASVASLTAPLGPLAAQIDIRRQAETRPPRARRTH